MIRTLFTPFILIILVILLLLPLSTQESKAEILGNKTFINRVTGNEYHNRADKVSSTTNKKSFKREDGNYSGGDGTRFEQGGTNLLDDGFRKGGNTGLWTGIKIRCNLLKWNCQ